MKLIDKVISIIEANREKNFNCLPFTEIFPKFSQFIPGVQKGMYYAITGSPSAGKSQFTDFAFLYHAYDMIKEGAVIDVTYFTFEMSKELKTFTGISKRLFEVYGEKYSPRYLQSIGYKLPYDVVEKVKECRDYFAEMEDHVTFHDIQMTPTQIAKVIDRKLEENGYMEHKLVTDPAGNTRRVPDRYVQNNPDKYLIFIFDHISLITPERGQTLHQALAQFSLNNVAYRNRYGITIVNVHQQALEGSIERFGSGGNSIMDKVEPQLALLGDNRTLGRDYDMVFGLFSPSKFEANKYRGYQVHRFKDHCRWLSVLKNRHGVPDVHIGLYFDGAVNYFQELPKPEEFSIIQNTVKSDNNLLYEKYEKGLVGIPEKQKRFNFS